MAVQSHRLVDAQNSDWEVFSGLQFLTNHWNRSGWWPGRCAYYWYLSFRDNAAVQEMAVRCQSVVITPDFDPVPLSDLHMTLERVAFEDEISRTELAEIVGEAELACSELEPFAATVGPLAGSSGALSFSVSPRETLMKLRSLLVRSAVSAGRQVDGAGGAPFRPHVGIAYCNQQTDAQRVVARVGSLRDIPPVQANVDAVSLVTLKRGVRSYTWDVIEQLVLGTAA
jgi:hypothetical protein